MENKAKGHGQYEGHSQYDTGVDKDHGNPDNVDSNQANGIMQNGLDEDGKVYR